MKKARYLYCIQCKDVRPLVSRHDSVSNAGQQCCQKCGKAIPAGFSKKTCRICGNELFAPDNMLLSLIFPCHPEQTIDQSLIHSAVPSPGNSSIIAWKNPGNRCMVHLEAVSGTAKKKPLLQVANDQFVILESSGRYVAVMPGISGILRGKMDLETIIWLVKSGYDPMALSSSASTKLYFIDTKEHRFSGQLELTVEEANANLSIPFTMTARLDLRQAKGLLTQAYDWSSDDTINSALKDTVTETVSQALKATISAYIADNKDIPQSELVSRLQLVLNPRILTDLSNKANRDLCWKGIALSRRIEINFNSIDIEILKPDEPEEEPEKEEQESSNPLAGEFGCFRYSTDPSGGIIITGFSGEITEATIPDKISGQPVVAIGKEAFAHCDNLLTVFMPSCVRKIEERAFFDCSSLMRISFPSDLSQIDKWAFSQCGALTELSFSRNLTIIGDYAFSNCPSIRKISFCEGLRSIGNYSFTNCSSLMSVKFPRGLERIGVQAFSNCHELSRIVMPASLENIGQNAFWHCSDHLSADISAGSYAENWCKASGITCKTSFEWVDKGDSIELTRYTGNEKDVRIPSAIQGKPIKSIAERCFSKNSVIQNVILPDGLDTIGTFAFSDCIGIISISLPSSLTKINISAFANCRMLKEITIPGSVSRISNNAFENCRSLKHVTIENGVQFIETKGFYNCTSLESVELPTTMKKIGMMAFGCCALLNNVHIPEGTSELGPGAFGNCAGLQRIGLPKSIVYIGPDTFTGCHGELTCYVQSGSYAERISRGQKIKISHGDFSPAIDNQKVGRFCPKCGGRLSVFTGKCKNCGI